MEYLNWPGKFEQNKSCFTHLPDTGHALFMACFSEGLLGWVGIGDSNWHITRWIDLLISRVGDCSSFISQFDILISILWHLFSTWISTLAAKSYVLLSTLTKIAAFLDFPFPLFPELARSDHFFCFIQIMVSYWVFSLQNSFPIQVPVVLKVSMPFPESLMREEFLSSQLFLLHPNFWYVK